MAHKAARSARHRHSVHAAERDARLVWAFADLYDWPPRAAALRIEFVSVSAQKVREPAHRRRSS